MREFPPKRCRVDGGFFTISTLPNLAAQQRALDAVDKALKSVFGYENVQCDARPGREVKG